MKKLIGQVNSQERDTIQMLFERKSGLAELAKILTSDNEDLYEKLVKEDRKSTRLNSSHSGE